MVTRLRDDVQVRLRGYLQARLRDCLQVRLRRNAVLGILAVLTVAGADAPVRVAAQAIKRSDAPPPEAPPRVRERDATRAPSTAPVNVNVAGVKELMTLDGVGKKAAERIVAHREQYGPFRKPDEIRKVDGLGGEFWEKNRARITVK